MNHSVNGTTQSEEKLFKFKTLRETFKRNLFLFGYYLLPLKYLRFFVGPKYAKYQNHSIV